ncbi:transporter substrate-binding domain-containing protein, partial [Bacillus cereus]|uniref:transporter substrate-binding domain-containing protein n=1 Tax=Bacillus cereus TaxID=1396 RepID=UPI00284BEF3E
KIKIVDTEKEASQIGFLYSKGRDKLVQEAEKALEDMKKDGTYDKITNKWFSENVYK